MEQEKLLVKNGSKRKAKMRTKKTRKYVQMTCKEEPYGFGSGVDLGYILSSFVFLQLYRFLVTKLLGRI